MSVAIKLLVVVVARSLHVRENFMVAEESVSASAGESTGASGAKDGTSEGSGA